MHGVCPISLDPWPYELDEVSALGLNQATDLYGSVAKRFSCPKMLRWGVGKEPTANMLMRLEFLQQNRLTNGLHLIAKWAKASKFEVVTIEHVVCVNWN
jgi:hypothetical protein